MRMHMVPARLHSVRALRAPRDPERLVHDRVQGSPSIAPLEELIGVITSGDSYNSESNSARESRPTPPPISFPAPRTCAHIRYFLNPLPPAAPRRTVHT